MCIFSFRSKVRGARTRHLLSSKASNKLASGDLASGSSWTKAPSSWLSGPGRVAERAEGSCLVSLVQAVALESLGKSGKPENAQVLNKPAPRCRDKRLLHSACAEKWEEIQGRLAGKATPADLPPVSSLLERANVCVAGSSSWARSTL